MKKIPTTIDLISLTLNRDNKKQYYLTAIYSESFEDGTIRELKIPKISLPFDRQSAPVRCDDRINTITVSALKCDNIGSISLWDSDQHNNIVLTILPDSKGRLWESKITKYPDPKEMTIDEIEKKLGHPVKIVKEKNIDKN